MSPVFRHGGLRLYLLKLLDEAPRHGYDVIRLLQDRFMGVYSPSPGTIYPRLARLEEEGLVTHEVIDGKKVYKITAAGREELNRRFDDLADLEEELTASVRDIARELSRDVRETVRNLRDEFTWAVREAGRGAGTDRQGAPDEAGMPAGHADARTDEDAADRAQAEADRIQAEAERIKAEASRAQARADEARAAAERARAAAQAKPPRPADSVWNEAAAEAAAGDGPADHGPDGDMGGSAAGGPSTEGQERGRGWREWAEWAERRDWREWARASQAEWKERARAGQQEWAASRAKRSHQENELAGDLERLAAAVARELRGVAGQAGSLSEDAVGNLGRILTDTLTRIRTEVFRPPDAGGDEESR